MTPYCLNIHKTDTLADVCAAIERYTCAVKARVSPDAPYPVGLRLSAQAATELADVEALERFEAFLGERQLFVTGINGFPYGAFHGAPVKTAVYEPDWATPERFKYTLDLSTVLACLLPKGAVGSISTLPLAYQSAVLDETKLKMYVRQITMLALYLDTLLREEGQHIVLAIEPEPDCMLEDTDTFINWFENEFLDEGRRWMSASRRRTPEEAEEILRRHVGICFDTCHFALAFEKPLDALHRFERAGIRIARVQLSAAIRATIGDASLDALGAFVEPVYLHQTRVRPPRRSTVTRYPDLTAETLAAVKAHTGAELRTHFHVPLFWEGDGALGTTHGDLSPEFFAHVAAQGYPLEIETYTFDVLPPALRAGDVVEHLVKETEWAMERAGKK
ncbi:MAG: metabolite traffic protein EboE [Kiritimatiellaeota bacterium]|nr:metabolite traffic protein EboE [Kiritimatiellota bacterium]